MELADVARARRDPGLVVLEGFHAVKHALRFGGELLGAWTADAEAIEALRGPLVALARGGGPLRALPPRAVLAFGTERDGLSAELLARADARIALPMAPGVSSLNLATAVAAV